MANEDKSKYFEELTRYQYANVAVRLANDKEDSQFAVGALEKLVDSFGIDKDIIEGLRKGAFASKEGIQTAMGIYAGKYQKALDGLNFNEFYDVRSKTISSILGDKANDVKKVFEEKYKDQTIGSVMKKYRQAAVKVEDDTGLFDEKAKEEAEKTMKKLQSIVQIIQLIEKRNYDELKNGATKDSYKKTISELLKEA